MPSDKEGETKEKKEIFKINGPADLQRIKLERLMKNPAKPVVIPERPKSSNKLFEAPDFVRNVMGSSAGAGSGEFHVYRHIRRREYARQKVMQIMSEKEERDQAFQKKLEENKQKAEERTAKKRAKRLKKKQKQKNVKKAKGQNQQETSSSEESESETEQNEKSEKTDSTEKDDKPAEPAATIHSVENETS